VEEVIYIPNRIIKESICFSEDIERLTPQEEIFFYRLIVNCDDFGRLDARIPILKAKLYPLKENVKSSDIERYLKKLSTIKPNPLITLYFCEEKRYLQMVNWDKHQQIRAKRSKYPSLEEATLNVISDDIICNQMNAYVPENPNPNPNPNPIRESKSKSAIEIAMDDFKEFRKKIKAPMTEKAVELILKELDKLAKDDDTKIAILHQSIQRGWKGVFALSQQNKKDSGSSNVFFDILREEGKM
jgi:hypothetical protein